MADSDSVINGWLQKIGDTVAHKRASLDMKQDALADAAEVSRKSISDIENANTDWQIKTFLRILLALKVDVFAFFGGSKAHAPKRRIDHDVLHQRLDEILQSGEDAELIVKGAIESFHQTWVRGRR